MDNIPVLKAADNVDNRVNLADIGEKLIAQAFAFGSTLDQSGNIDKLNDSRGDRSEERRVGKECL